MTSRYRFMHGGVGSGRVATWAIFLALFLVGTRLVAAYFCATCFSDWEKAKTRAFYLHSGWDQALCHHGFEPINPLIAWACTANDPDSGFVLPEIPLVPILVSLFVPLTFLFFSYRATVLIPAHGRGPPPSLLLS